MKFDELNAQSLDEESRSRPRLSRSVNGKSFSLLLHGPGRGEVEVEGVCHAGRGGSHKVWTNGAD